jgi:membrane carboxypeptidase/penicillin-binding protein
VRTLTRPELTAALAVRQGLAERLRAAPADAVRRLTPLQAQHPPAPYLALAARVEGFAREGLEAAITDGAVVKTTINRLTLHLAAAADYPAYAQLTRQARMRTWRKQFAHLDEE